MAVSQIQYWNRYTQRLEVVTVYGDRWLRLMYETALGRLLLDFVLTRPWFSAIYGWLQSTGLSGKKIPKFIQEFKIPMHQYESGPFRSFNDFFIRRFLPGQRTFVKETRLLAAPAEGRYFGFEKITEDLKFPVKGKFLSANEILGSDAIAKDFMGGPFLLIRLCPVDYHRYHYPDEGKTLDFYSLHAKLHSVNPVAIEKKPDVFITNERRVSVIETKNFGKLAYVEVGALCVGKIVQTHDETKSFSRGDEKGMFLFGGSTVLILGQPGFWKPSADILEHTANQIETYVHLGDEVASRI